MNAKKLVTTLLLLFVAVSAGTIAVKEWSTQTATPASVSVNAPVPAAVSSTPATSEKASQAKVVAYYFHGNMRCRTCKAIEALTREAIETGFADDIKNGRVALEVVNIEEAGNEHYVQDYQMTLRSVVLVRYEGSKQGDWKRLDEVWKLVGNRDEFIRLVREQTTNLLQGKAL
jgi:hypothetical protein